MEKEYMNKVRKYAVEQAQLFFGFAGVADGDDLCIINTGKDRDIQIEMKIEN
jgi:hypothetical protein